MNSSSRRQFVKDTAAGIGFLTVPSFSGAENIGRPLKIVCVGAHPDDPESGCGATLAKFAAAGHAVTIIYLTSGEAGIPGRSNEEAAAIRSKEAIAACLLLKAKPVFAGQIDGDTIINNEWVKKMQDLLAVEKPDVVFTHWPIDSHKDHQCASLLTIQSWIRAAVRFELYFFEVCAGEQTIGFKPTDYVDITDTQALKKKAVYCHVSQDPAGIYACGHTAMEQFRGLEMGTAAAEGFIRMTGKKKGNYFDF